MEGKRVSWVELYLDLVFVLAIGQIAHLIVAEPEMHSVWVAFGLFFVSVVDVGGVRGALQPPRRGRARCSACCSWPAACRRGWRRSRSSRPRRATVTVFAISLAVTRLVLAVANGQAGGRTQLLQLRITRALLTSAALFLVSAWVPEPFTYVLWVIGIGDRVGRDAERGPRGHAPRAATRTTGSELAPADPAEALDAHHFAERFGLFLIILLGEVLVEAGQSRRRCTSAPPAAGRRWSRRWCWPARCGGCTSTPWRT